MTVQPPVRRKCGALSGVMVCCAAIACFALGSARLHAAEWYVGCAHDTGEVVFSETSDGQGFSVVSGPFPGRRTAEFWVDENCPDNRCAGSGPCSAMAPPAAPNRWVPVCDTTTGDVSLVTPPLPAGARLLTGIAEPVAIHDDEVEGRVWVSRVCPTWQCDGEGRCVHSASERPGADAGGWVAGELSSVALSRVAAQPAARPPTGPAGPIGPGSADLTPLINTITAAAAACNFRAALAGADHLTNFDLDHAWLAPNHYRVRRLAGRQVATEQAVWQASAELSSGKLKKARKMASSAADTALSCQSDAVAGLIRGIDTAIEQRKMERSAKMSRAAAAMLPGLVDMARVMSGASHAGAAPSSADLAAVTARALGVTLPGGVDPCAFAYEYRNAAVMEPACTCAGYVFDVRRFTCVPAGG